MKTRAGQCWGRQAASNSSMRHWRRISNIRKEEGRSVALKDTPCLLRSYHAWLFKLEELYRKHAIVFDRITLPYLSAHKTLTLHLRLSRDHSCSGISHKPQIWSWVMVWEVERWASTWEQWGRDEFLCDGFNLIPVFMVCNVQYSH